MGISRREFLRYCGVTTVALTSFREWPLGPVAEISARTLSVTDWKELADIALERARRLGASYADIRLIRSRRETVAIGPGGGGLGAFFAPEEGDRRGARVTRSESLGFGVRVLYRGTWGFSASPLITPDEIRRIAEEAVAIARANAAINTTRVRLAPVKAYRDTWQTPIVKNPFDVSLEEKIGLLVRVDETGRKVRGVARVSASLAFVHDHKRFASTEGSYIEQHIYQTLPNLTVTAMRREVGPRPEIATRNAFIPPQSIGYEYVEQLKWGDIVEQIAHEAVEMLSAKEVSPGRYTLLIAPSNLYLTIHETIGHSTELDRVLGYEANFAGTSFLTLDKLGKYRVGSKIVNFVADRTTPGGLATVGYDDDGVPAQRWHLIREGILVGYQTTRELAHVVRENFSRGCSYADSWSSMPIPRMPNVWLEPGKEKLSPEDLIADTKEGILIEGRGSYSIDQQRLNFQFGGNAFWEIKNGKKVGMLRNVVYQSYTPEFWNSCDAICSQEYWVNQGTPGDGKGEPQQTNSVSHGCAMARFRNITVFNSGSV
ncbi:MAG: TldD/PmbA family protein [Blastocatellia bacterium]|nr:TldD/PmbA family protein [Blastocatellia bacterium]MCS7158614.1 TldD/PmbA family protein [Blastocatellia bacterium]MCX7753540.1 TldD/PmbA family protein [Blastocatellia bacterium]MDW8168188.1 TldD/PmbA family protein [Acidobacteriota bacterium]MDW8255395.1 TldD/PmbA family protein [Acidobacteriota bacterium]